MGIVSRANLVRALTVTESDPAVDVTADDHTNLLAELMGEEWFKIWAADVVVKDRVVHFWLAANQTEDERRALRIAAENITGVRRVDEHVIPSL